MLNLGGGAQVGHSVGLFPREFGQFAAKVAVARRLLVNGALEVKALNWGSLADVAVSGEGAPLVVLLDRVTDPHNVGAILRSAEVFGARAVIVSALVILIVSALFVFLFREEGKLVFWVGGIVLSAAVGPAQASSRSLLARVAPDDMQGEVFGLYATTGRVMSFLSPLLWSLFIGWFGATHFGILGIVLILVIGLVLLLLVRLPKHVRE